MNKFLHVKNNQDVEYLIDSAAIDNLIIHPAKNLIQVFLKSGKPMTIPGYVDVAVGDISELFGKEKEVKKKKKEPKEIKTDESSSIEFGHAV